MILTFSILLITSVINTKLNDNAILGDNRIEDNPSSQMNYIKDQLHLDPYVWDTLGYTGNSNASIAIIGSGIDYTHSKFGLDSYGDKDFSKKIIGWKDYVNVTNSDPIDPNGLSTFTAASAYGQNDSDSKVPLDSENRTTITLGNKFLQTELFPSNPGPGWFKIKLGSFFIDQDNANITLNGTYTEYNANFIQNASFQILTDSTMLNETSEDAHGLYRQLTYTTGSQPAIYDFYFSYSLDFSKPVNFSVNAMIKIPLESNFDYSGIAPDTKIIGLRVLDKNLEGNVSSLVSALNWTKDNRDDYHIVGVQIDLGQYNWDVPTIDLSEAIESVIESGIMVFIPSGDNLQISDSLNPLVVNELPIVVGSVSDIGKLTYYTSLGQELSSNHTKIDILAPGGSYLAGHRTIIAADTNENDATAYLNDQSVNDSTSLVSSSISTGFVAASYNLLIEAIGGYSVWETIRTADLTLALKSRLLMTASEVNQVREDNPETTIIDESESTFSPILDRGGKDTREGFGLLNIPAALESLLFEISDNSQITNSLVSVPANSTGVHSFARRIHLTQNEYYKFNLTFTNTSDLDFFIYENISDTSGDPTIIQESTSSGNTNESLVFGLEQESGEYVVVVKAVSGELTNFTLNVTHMINVNVPTLTDHTVNGIQGFNDTLDTFEFIINYTDLDDLPPITMDLNITGIPYLIPFSQVTSDTNYTDGCLYSSQYRFYEIGVYEYHIIAWDGVSLVRSPGISNYSLEVVTVQNAIYNNYTWEFPTIDNWNMDGGWNNISQINSIDTRALNTTTWNALYFGDDSSISLGEYSYESLSELSISSAYSPQIWINGSSTPVLQVGTRISINQGDYFMINARSNRTGSWETLDSFTNLESEWIMLEYDLHGFANSYVQIQFMVILDLFNDMEQNKGVILAEFNLLQQPIINLHSTRIFNSTVTPSFGPKYQEFQYSAIVGDQDGVTPDLVYLEIDNINYTMFNILGVFDGSFVLDNETLQSGGITYAYDIFLATVSNSSFRIHVRENGDFISTEFFNGPEISSQINATFPYYGIPSNMSVYGNPQPQPSTIWVSSSNSFHYISRDAVWYSGENYYMGYGENWDVYMVTSLIHIPPSNEENDRVFLWFEHQLIFDSPIPTLFDDYAQIMISSDLGDHWYDLDIYEENIDGYQLQKIDLWNYKGMDVLIRFEFHSDDTGFLPTSETGWYLRNIMVNVDESIDNEPPTILFTNIIPNMEVNETFTIEITILDPSGVDDELVILYINTVSIDDAISENGVIRYELDTTRFRNGNTTVSVIAYDLMGNQHIESTYISIQNERNQFTWVYVIVGVAVVLIAGILFFYFQLLKPAKRKRELAKEMLTEEDKQKLLEKQRARELEELRIREEAELATSESEALKPYTYKCKRCSKQFQNKEYIWSMMCPDCNTDTLDLEYQCKICGKFYYYDLPGEHFCKDCDIKLLK